MKTKEVIKNLQIKGEYTCFIEPYWKFSDMFVSNVETQCGTFPKNECLQRLANKWMESSDRVLTTDTIPDNTIKISDIAMIKIWL